MSHMSNLIPEESRGIHRRWQVYDRSCFFETDGIFSGCAVAQQPQMVKSDSVSGGSPKKSLQWLRTGDGTRRFRSILVYFGTRK